MDLDNMDLDNLRTARTGMEPGSPPTLRGVRNHTSAASIAITARRRYSLGSNLS